MNKSVPENPHFSLEPLAGGVYACIHKPGGAAYSNAGIIDLGDRTLVVDAHEHLVAGRALRQAAETLFKRPVETLVLTHGHGDHWIGTSAFDERTTVLATKEVSRIVNAEGPEVMQMIRKPGYWEDQIKNAEKKLNEEKDEQVRTGLLNQVTRCHYGLTEKSDFQPRRVDKVFKDTFTLKGSLRSVEIHAMGWGHSKGDAVVLLRDEKIAFIGDIGFFNTQPYMGACHLEDYRQQVRHFLDSEYETFIPGHGPVGKKNDLSLQLEYFDALEMLVGEVVKNGSSVEDAMHVTLPEKYHPWLVGGMRRFEVNVRYMVKYLAK